jgi:hypothetical protein
MRAPTHSGEGEAHSCSNGRERKLVLLQYILPIDTPAVSPPALESLMRLNVARPASQTGAEGRKSPHPSNVSQSCMRNLRPALWPSVPHEYSSPFCGSFLGPICNRPVVSGGYMSCCTCWETLSACLLFSVVPNRVWAASCASPEDPSAMHARHVRNY